MQKFKWLLENAICGTAYWKLGVFYGFAFLLCLLDGGGCGGAEGVYTEKKKEKCNFFFLLNFTQFLSQKKKKKKILILWVDKHRLAAEMRTCFFMWEY